MSNKLYWVWAQNALGISASVKSDEIVSYFGNAEKLYYAGEYEWKISGIFTNGQINKLKATSLDSAEKIVAECEKYKIKIVTPDDDNYPSMLFKLPNLPLVLYVRGDLDCLKNKIAVAMVGAREASDIGVRIARSLSASLSRSGAVVVSGAAKGIDSAAHTGALNVVRIDSILSISSISGYLSAYSSRTSIALKTGFAPSRRSLFVPIFMLEVISPGTAKMSLPCSIA